MIPENKQAGLADREARRGADEGWYFRWQFVITAVARARSAVQENTELAAFPAKPMKSGLFCKVKLHPPTAASLLPQLTRLRRGAKQACCGIEDAPHKARMVVNMDSVDQCCEISNGGDSDGLRQGGAMVVLCKAVADCPRVSVDDNRTCAGWS